MSLLFLQYRRPFTNPVRKMATYTVDVYLTRDHPKLGKAGSVVEVQPGHARNVLVPRGLAIQMGEGKFRKHIPILHHRQSTGTEKLSQRAISMEMQKWMLATGDLVPDITTYLAMQNALTPTTTTTTAEGQETTTELAVKETQSQKE